MKSSRMAALLALAALAAGCVGSQAFRQAQAEEEFGHWDFAVLKYAQAVDQNPGNDGYKVALKRAKLKASQVHFERGKLYRSAGNPELAVVELEQAVVLDQTNKYAEVELRKAHEDAARLAAERSSETKLEATKRRARGQRAKAPILEPTSDRPISLNFPTPKPIKQIYQSLAAAAGINVVFDPQLKDDNVTIVLNNIEFQKALETLMRQENHFYKVIDEKTIMIATDNPQNRKTYEDLVLRTFYLSNGDLMDVSNAIRSLLQTTRISVNKAENSITLRDTADKVAIAERIVEQNDKQLSEVVIDIELLEVNSDKLQDLGLVLQQYSVGLLLPSPGGTTDLGFNIPAFAPASPQPPSTFTWSQLGQLTPRSLGYTIPSGATLNFIKSNTDSELLAKPQLRISEGQKAQLIIGDKTPIPTTSFNTSTTAGTNVVPITSFTYQDVGIKIDVEPRVHHNREITLKLTIEVSQLGATINFGQGQSAPQIGTRTITSNIRLKDGETNFLAGLYRTDKTKTITTIPFLGDIPVIGRLLSDHNTEVKSTDLVLTLTPHIIRIPDITEDDVTPVYVGTDSNISFQGTPRIESPTGGTGPFDMQRQVPTPAPRTGVPGAPASPPPQNLAPNPFPNDPFRQPPPQPTPVPQQPGASSAASAPSTESVQAAAVESTAVESTAAAVPAASVFSFDTAFVSLAPGQQRSVVLRASGDTLTMSSMVLVFDPKVAAVTSVRPILASNGVADATIQNGAALIRLPEGTPLAGTRAIAEITLYGVAAGRSALSVEGAGAGASVVIEVR